MFGIDDAINGGVSLAGGFSGMLAGAQGNRRAQGYLNTGIQGLQGTNVQGDNAWAGQTEDPTGRNAQLGALSNLQGVADNRGWDAGARAAWDQTQRNAGQYEQGQRDAVMSRAQQQGAGTSGNALASQLGAVSQGANRAEMGGAQATADARQRALYAAQAYGQEGGAVRQGDLGFQSTKNNATNSINQFNASQRLGQAQSVADMYRAKAGAASGAGGQLQRGFAGMGQAAGAFGGGLYGAWGGGNNGGGGGGGGAGNGGMGNPYSPGPLRPPNFGGG